MPSTFTWLDYSEHERHQFDEIIKGFNEPDTRDELGLGSVRDAFAEMLFPGISTIQTRARYFLFVPWIYQEVERRRERPAAASARNREISLINHLARSSDTEGVIGIDARATLKRLPSSIYWQGLGAWGIRVFPGSQDEYHRLLDSGGSDGHRAPITDDGDVLDGDIWRRWHAGIPPAPRAFPTGASFQLTSFEAQFLRERIVSQRPGTMLAFLVDHGQPHARLDFPWEHPQLGEMPAAVQERLRHAHNFSESMFGASLLYNLMLAQKAEVTELANLYREGLQGWAEVIEERRSELAQWHSNLSDFWRIATGNGAGIPVGARQFVELWLGHALAAANTAHIADAEPARQLIHGRERSLKRDLARLDNQRALELWTGAAGAYAHNYRWPAAQRIVLDILTGLAQEDGHASA